MIAQRPGDIQRQAWQLLSGRPRALGRWALELGDRAVAVCEDAARGEVVLATRGGGSGALLEAPRLLGSPLPGALSGPAPPASSSQ